MILLKIICLAILVSCILDNAQGTLSRSLNRRSVVNNSDNAVVSNLSNQQIDVSLSLEAELKWENFITPGPTIISLLGQLMVISGKVDFSLTENTPVNGFKYIRRPSSFRATLVQVSNDGWDAFMNAHKNMDKIQLYMQQIPSRVKTALKVILDSSPTLVKRLLPQTLKQIQDIGEQCILLSAETETKFNDVMLLLGEVLESAESSRGRYDTKLLAARVELNTSLVQKQQLENIAENLRKRQADIDAQVKKYQDAYEKALKEIPTGWKALAQDFVRMAVNVINVATMSFSSGGFSGQTGSATQNARGDFSTAHLLGIMQQFGEQISKLKHGITEVFNDVDGSVQNPSDMFQAFNIAFGTVENLLSEVVGQAGQKSIQLIQRGKRICTRMRNIYKNVLNLNITDDEKGAVLEEVDILYKSVQPMSAASAYSSNGMSMQSTGQWGTPSSVFTGKSGNERFKAYMNLELLRDAQSRSDKVFEDVLKFQEEMKKLMSRMATLNLESISFKEIIELIKETIIILAQIREHWSKLVQFFAIISVRAEVALDQTLTPFIRMSEAAQNVIGANELTDQNRQFFKEILQKQAVDIHKVAFFLYTLSKTYVDVSSQFLMDRLAGLARMLAISDETQRQTMLQELKTQSEEAQIEIKQIFQEKRHSYKRLVQQRIDDVNRYVHHLGGPNRADQEAARKGIGAVKAKESNPNNPFDIDSFIYDP